MARVTVEDCVKKVPNRFELVVLAAERAKDITSGAPLTIEKDNDKNPVISLREIANGNICPDALRENQVSSLQKNNKVDSNKEENLHAESSEEVDAPDLADYADDSALQDTFSHDQHAGEDVEMDFSDNITDED